MDRKKRNILLCLLFAFAGLLAVPVRAEENTELTYMGMHYALDSASGEITITGYTDAVKNALEIPSFIDGKKVTAIACYAFQDCTRLNSIRIPGGVKEIGYDAFKGCNRLESVTVENGVQEIGHCAFSGCSCLKEIVIPDGVTAIGAHAFEQCKELANIHIPDSVTRIGTDAEEWDHFEAILGYGTPEKYKGSTFEGCSALAEIVLPSHIERIYPSTFKDCVGLKNIEIPDSVKCIDESAFESCSGLLGLAIEDGVNSIGMHAFKGCTSLTEVVLPDSVTTIGSIKDVFLGMSFIGAGGGAALHEEREKGGIFENCTALASVRLSKNIGNIYPNTFAGCISLRHMEIPKGITIIGTEAFKDCRNLEEIAIPDSVTLIDTYAFSGCISLKNLEIPDSVTAIGSVKTVVKSTSGGVSSYYLDSEEQGGAFSGCTSLTSVRLPQSLEKIYPATFENCSALNNVILPPKTTAVNQDAFSGCTSLTSIYIPPSITSLDMDSSGLGQSVRHIYGEKGSYAETLATGSSCEFKENVYCIFDANGGNVSEKQRLVFPGSVYGELPVPVKEKSQFLGWYTEADGGGNVTADTKVTAEKSHTLYARWKQNDTGGNKPEENNDKNNSGENNDKNNPGENNDKNNSDKNNGQNNSGESTDKNKPGKNTGGVIDPPSDSKKKQAQTITVSSKTVAYKSKPFSLKAKASGGGKLTYKSSNKKVATVSSKGKVTVKGYGKATITVKAAGKGNYQAAAKKITIKVVPKTPALKKASSPGKRRISASWRKDKTVDGYQMYICLRKDFKKGAYERTYKKTAASMSLTGLKSKKTYYLRLRSYKKVGKKKFYSKWSKVNSVKVK